MDHLFKRVDLSKVDPKFLEKCKELLSACEKQGAIYYAISAYRDPFEQDELYAIGRTKELDRKPVTKARGFKSFHNYGLSIDFCKDKDATKAGLQPSWNIDDYKLLADEAVKLGLVPGFYFRTFKEGPHIQLGNFKLAELEKIYKSNGLEAVWKFVHS